MHRQSLGQDIGAIHRNELSSFFRKRVEANVLFAVDLVQKGDIYLVVPLEYGFSIYMIIVNIFVFERQRL